MKYSKNRLILAIGFLFLFSLSTWAGDESDDNEIRLEDAANVIDHTHKALSPANWMLASIFSIDASRPLFESEPHIDDIYQTNSLDCVYLSVLMSVLDAKGPEFIKNMIQESSDGRAVFVRLFNFKSKEKVIYKLAKKVDYENAYFGRRTRITLSSALWVHLLGRALQDHLVSMGYSRFPLTKATDSISVSAVLKSFLGGTPGGRALVLSNRAAWNQNQNVFQKNNLIGIVGILPDGQIENFYRSHAYALLSQVEGTNQDAVKRILVFNPWKRIHRIAFRDPSYSPQFLRLENAARNMRAVVWIEENEDPADNN